MTARSPVGVVGASARAAVHSLARAGLPAWAVDLFGDRDLTRLAPAAVCPLDQYPEAIPKLAARFPPGPVLYSGGLENHPRVIAELSASRELWSNPPEVLARVRAPQTLFTFLHSNGFSSPHLLPPGEPCPSEGRWLLKQRKSSGGVGVRVAMAGERPRGREYLQEFVPGRSMSAVYRADRSRVEILGISEQLTGTPWLYGGGFKYAGNIGPDSVPASVESQLRLLGEILVTQADLRGVFGVDFVLHEGRAWVLEVNPRYPASVEVLELATGRAAFGSGGDSAIRAAGSPRVVGKAIYYAPYRLSFPAAGPWEAELAGEFDPWRLPAFADIPPAEAVIEPGWPVITVFAAGSSPEVVRERLQSRAAELDQFLAGNRHDPE